MCEICPRVTTIRQRCSRAVNSHQSRPHKQLVRNEYQSIALTFSYVLPTALPKVQVANRLYFTLSQTCLKKCVGGTKRCNKPVLARARLVRQFCKGARLKKANCYEKARVDEKKTSRFYWRGFASRYGTELFGRRSPGGAQWKCYSGTKYFASASQDDLQGPVAIQHGERHFQLQLVRENPRRNGSMPFHRLRQGGL
jgi:hypothetical protein